MQLSEKQTTFYEFFFPVLESILNFKYFETKDHPHRFCISETTDSKNVVRSMSKKSPFRGLFDKQHGKPDKALSKCMLYHLYYIHWSLPSELTGQKSLLLTCQVSGLLVITLASDEKYPFLKRDNWTIAIEMKLSQKQNPFSEFFAAFLKSSLNSKHSGKEVTLIVFVFWKLSSPKKVVRKMAQKSCFRGPFDKQHGRPSQALLKSPSQHLYHIHWSLPSQFS